MKNLLWLLFAVLIVAGYRALPDQLRYQLSDAWHRQFAPDFDWLPDSMENLRQEAVIKEYERKGFRLKCYGNLRSEEKIGKESDYLCWALVKNAYGDIPARMVSFFFTRGELRHVRLELPQQSFEPLRNYLSHKLRRAHRIEQQVDLRADDGTDRPPLIWMMRKGLLSLSEPPADQPALMLWSSRRSFRLAQRAEPRY